MTAPGTQGHSALFEVRFKPDVFFRFFFYHALFPFSLPVMIIREGKVLVNALSLNPVTKGPFGGPRLEPASLVINLLGAYAVMLAHDGLDQGLFVVLVSQLARAGMVALKYAYFTRADLAALGLENSGASTVDQLLVSWANPTLRSVHRNLFATALSRRIDTGPALFSFFVPSPPEAPRAQLDAVHKALETGSADLDAQTSDLCCLHLGQGEWGPDGPHGVGSGRVRISAIWVMARIILRGCRDALRPWYFRSPPIPFGFMLSLPFAAYPQLVLYISHGFQLATRGDGSKSTPVAVIALVFAQAVLIWVFLGIQYAFLISGVIDYTRRAHMVRQLDSLVGERHYVAETDRTPDDVAAGRRHRRVSDVLHEGRTRQLLAVAQATTATSDRKLGGVRTSSEDADDPTGEGPSRRRRLISDGDSGDDMSDDGGVSEPIVDPLAELRSVSSGPGQEADGDAGPSAASQRYRLRDLAHAKLRDDATLQETFYTVGARRPVRARTAATLPLDSMQNMRAWLQCRWMLLHLGHHFLARVQVNSSLALALVFLLLGLVFFLLFLRLSVDFLLHLIVYLVVTTTGLLVAMVWSGAAANESTDSALDILLHREWHLAIALQRLRQLGDLAESRTRILMEHLDDARLRAEVPQDRSRLAVARDPVHLLARARQVVGRTRANSGGDLLPAVESPSGAEAGGSTPQAQQHGDNSPAAAGRSDASRLPAMNFMLDETVWALSKGNVSSHTQLEQHLDEVRQQLDAVRWTASQVRTSASVEPLRILGIQASTGMLSSIATLAGTAVFVVARQVFVSNGVFPTR